MIPARLRFLGICLLLTSAVTPALPQMPPQPPTGQNLVWATVAFEAVARADSARTMELFQRTIRLIGMKDKGAHRRELRAILKQYPNPDRLKQWSEALTKQVKLQPPSDSSPTAGAAEILARGNAFLEIILTFQKDTQKDLDEL